MAMELATGDYLKIHERGAGAREVQSGDRHQIVEAVDVYLREGRDSWLILRDLAGMEYQVRASAVQSFSVSTPEGRLRALQVKRAQMEEYDRMREEAGVPLVRESPYPWELDS
jgi:hypothetical protein